ncbi:MAG TPA: hypothetical protein VM734_12205, partial [Kofleriaceae bacterium]|nr:hypothetical protein [Kofleriaceae bacterium]
NRLDDALLETGVEFSYAWKDVDVIPARTLPPRALVVAVTPLLDERARGQGSRRDHVDVLPRVAELDAGLEQRVDETILLDETTAGLEPAQNASEGHEPDAVAPLEVAAGHRCSRADGLLERPLVGRPRLREAVEEDDDVRIPLRVALVDDERAAPSRGAPVDRPHAVAGDERAGVRELEPLSAEPGDLGSRRSLGVGGGDETAQALGRRVDLQRAAPIDAPLEPDEADVVSRAEPHLADLDRGPAHAAKPERNADVVVFLDSFAEARTSDEGTLEQAVRTAATVSRRYLERRDRVGLVAFGGILRWLEPGGGLVQQYRLVDALLETGVEFSYAWKDVDVIPARTLPPRALVVAVTPLLDERSIGALLDLCGRGHDLVVLEISPEPFLEPGSDRSDLAALRLWRLQRAELRARFERLGAAVATLDDDVTMEEALEGVRAYRRHARLVQR